jgi:hypothetical protein
VGLTHNLLGLTDAQAIAYSGVVANPFVLAEDIERKTRGKTPSRVRLFSEDLHKERTSPCTRVSLKL